MPSQVEAINVLVYEDDKEADIWIAKAKQGYRSWSTKVAQINEDIVRTPSQLNEKLSQSGGDRFRLAVIDLSIGGDHHAGLNAIKALCERSGSGDLPIVVFSSANNKRVRDSAYKAGATSYVKKPASADKRIDALADIFGYWIELNLAKSR